MHDLNYKLPRVLRRIAGILALAVGIAAPIGYFFVELKEHRASLDAEAELTARIVSSIGGADGWRLPKAKLNELFSRRPLRGYAEVRRVVDADDQVIAERADPLAAPVITRAADITWDGAKLGRVEISRSLRPTLIKTGAIAFFGVLIGCLTFLVFKIFPLKALSRVLAENARLFKETERKMREQEALNAIAHATTGTLNLDAVLSIALDKALEATGREQGYISLRDPTSGAISLAAHRGISPQQLDSLSRFRVRGGETDTVFETGKVVVVNDTTALVAPHQGSRALVWVPLKAKGLVIGTLTVATTTSRAFSSAEVRFLEAIGNLVGVAVDNARLFGETEHNLKLMQTLREIDQAVASTLDTNTLLDLLVQKVALALPSSAVTVQLREEDTQRLERVACFNLDQTEWKATRGREAQIVLKRKAPLAIRSLQTDRNADDRDFFARHGLVSYVGVPLIGKGETLGVLSVYTKYERAFTDDEIRFLAMLASQAAMALENSRLYERTKRQAVELDRANKLQADFTAMIAHDLRSPLTSVIGAAEMIESGLIGPVNADQQKWLRKIQATGRKLVELVSDFLDVAKIESGRIDLVKERVDLDELIRNAVESYLPLAREKQIALDAAVDSGLPAIHADPRRLDQVLANLISNAIKFTPEGGAVEVGARPFNDGVRVHVKDSGVGIRQDELGTLFEKYRQTTSGKTSKKKGTGLGLVIAKMIVEAHAGRIWVESEEGKGSTFLFFLPVSRKENPRARLGEPDAIFSETTL
ncbi:MAG TPA: GAF domain-containing sensor histidine kinase [Candidatus Acidoferrales bacterium]|nr:GAF domain-containing sensor histidine kinase [Candidatus Acidoferrales bacterium]